MNTNLLHSTTAANDEMKEASEPQGEGAVTPGDYHEMAVVDDGCNNLIGRAQPRSVDGSYIRLQVSSAKRLDALVIIVMTSQD